MYYKYSKHSLSLWAIHCATRVTIMLIGYRTVIRKLLESYRMLHISPDMSLYHPHSYLLCVDFWNYLLCLESRVPGNLIQSSYSKLSCQRLDSLRFKTTTS